jgi:hypothetical protein
VVVLFIITTGKEEEFIRNIPLVGKSTKATG